ncbi:Glycosyl transferase family 2 [Candidatus Omnitrophus magneticus]|uniref:Glycosyl transferase family 2 n=1 Tax=Candidatus Omnitrophus magneticus TaxID=1609969 RepID=A0A0F0CTT3_9BACT|nr:Glycosyl transferase family 2 [Candidatus Omnitrophus magneticus]
MKLSILIPVYNEINTIETIIKKVQAVEVEKEIVLVDDCSKDGTREYLKKVYGSGKANVKVIYHEKNQGKGTAVRTALSNASGKYVVIQDADLEYDPLDLKALLVLAEKNNKDAIFGSRFLKTWKATTLPHYLINKFLTELSNILFGGRLTDMETCYKMVKTDIMKSLNLRANRFELEPEITAKLLKRKCDIAEVPIYYKSRSYKEGKKINWRDGVHALVAILKLKFKGTL